MRELRPAARRFLTRADGIETRHSFSYGAHYDPSNVGWGALAAINTEHLDPGAGYDTHRHEDVEIVTWVTDGALAHQDSTGHGGVVEPGVTQRLSAGSGAEHSERNASDIRPLTFVQMMLRSEHWGAPEYASLDIPDGPGRHRAVEVRAAGWLEVVRPVEQVEIEVEARLLVHVTRGVIDVDGQSLGPGDELRLLAPEPTVRLHGDGEALVWHLA
ncbi:MAG: pirin family protein [Aeromicrobium sp.]|uniref:pirin family protein n=1 Tax=Aeromicrobium sp. TaxID=1871063 RepID=UPI0039E36ED8